MSPVPTDEWHLDRAGFTLIEVLATIAFIAVSLGAIGSLFATSTRGVRSIEQHLSLVETFRLVLANLPARDKIDAGRLTGETLSHRWQIDFAPYRGGGLANLPDSPFIPQSVFVRVQSPSGATFNAEMIRLTIKPQSKPAQ